MPTEHTILPGNVTIDSTTKYGEVTIKPGDGFRADGFGVGPKEMRETWNGFSDEKGYQFLKDMYAKNGMADSTQMQTLDAERTKSVEAAEAAKPVPLDQVTDEKQFRARIEEQIEKPKLILMKKSASM